MTPGEVLAWCLVAIAVMLTVLVLFVVLYAIIKSVRDANKTRKEIPAPSDTVYRSEDQ